MVFSDNTFIFFFLPIVVIGYFLLKEKIQNYFLLLVSIFFYAWGEPRFVFVILLSILVSYIFSILISYNHKKNKLSLFFLIIGICLNLGTLAIFKYLEFFITNINRVFGTTFPAIKMALPIGISFFIFQSISYIVDVYRQNVPVQKNPFYLALYISFFPQLVAGPIVRYNDIYKQLTERHCTFENFSCGAKRFMIGVSKKVLLANSLALVSDKAFSMPSDNLSLSFSWLGALAYTFQIFFDFSGYTDMAIGLGEIFGFHLPENFNYPYISKSISEFWRRWHISLGNWFRDYVYFPLGGSRVKNKSRVIFNLFIVWILTGLWHGASWNFVIWGMLYFVLIAFEKLTGFPNKFNNKLFSYSYQLLTLFFVILGWVLFRADGWNNALNYLRAMFTFNNGFSFDNLTFIYLSEYKFHFIFAILFSLPLKSFFYKRIKFSSNKLLWIENICVFILFFISVTYLSINSYNPFIYFNF